MADEIPKEVLPTESETSNEPIPALEQPIETISPESSTAQIPVNEPLAESVPEELPPSASLPEEKPPALAETQSTKISFARELLIKARNAIQFRKRKKLDRVMTLFLKQSKITNNEVEKFLHVSDATATRYLSQLEKEGKIKQNGKTGKGVSYSRI